MLWIYKESLVREHPKRFPRGEAVIKTVPKDCFYD